ncbi:hypothetical protein B0H12DRAFT_233312 [Mycena haematopus]|nr:hypothetical protein B0H12DRAFT_233312 [Mycena haematopus]
MLNLEPWVRPRLHHQFSMLQVPSSPCGPVYAKHRQCTDHRRRVRSLPPSFFLRAVDRFLQMHRVLWPHAEFLHRECVVCRDVHVCRGVDGHVQLPVHRVAWHPGELLVVQYQYEYTRLDGRLHGAQDQPGFIVAPRTDSELAGLDELRTFRASVAVPQHSA